MPCVGFHGLKSLNCEFESGNLRAQLSVEISVCMLGLCLSKDCLHHDVHLLNVYFKLCFLFFVARLVNCQSVTKHQFAQLSILLFVVVWSDLVEPKTHFLGIVFFTFSLFDMLFRFLFELTNHLIFSLAPSRVRGAIYVVVAVFVLTRSLLTHL